MPVLLQNPGWKMGTTAARLAAILPAPLKRRPERMNHYALSDDSGSNAPNGLVAYLPHSSRLNFRSAELPITNGPPDSGGRCCAEPGEPRLDRLLRGGR